MRLCLSPVPPNVPELILLEAYAKDLKKPHLSNPGNYPVASMGGAPR